MRILILFALGLFASLLPAGEAKKFEQTPDETKIFQLTNQERKKNDVAALTLNAALSKIARAHSANMARQRKMEHTLDDKTPFDRIKATGFKYSVAGENIAFGEDGASLPAIMKAWLESPGHRKNILLKDYTEIGVGISRAKDGSIYFTQVFAKPRK